LSHVRKNPSGFFRHCVAPRLPSTSGFKAAYRSHALRRPSPRRWPRGDGAADGRWERGVRSLDRTPEEGLNPVGVANVDADAVVAAHGPDPSRHAGWPCACPSVRSAGLGSGSSLRESSAPRSWNAWSRSPPPPDHLTRSPPGSSTRPYQLRRAISPATHIPDGGPCPPHFRRGVPPQEWILKRVSLEPRFRRRRSGGNRARHN
jgi:hypothetical protein